MQMLRNSAYLSGIIRITDNERALVLNSCLRSPANPLDTCYGRRMSYLVYKTELYARYARYLRSTMWYVILP